jgi:hypothetical protein
VMMSAPQCRESPILGFAHTITHGRNMLHAPPWAFYSILMTQMRTFYERQNYWYTNTVLNKMAYGPLFHPIVLGFSPPPKTVHFWRRRDYIRSPPSLPRASFLWQK